MKKNAILRQFIKNNYPLKKNNRPWANLPKD